MAEPFEIKSSERGIPIRFFLNRQLMPNEGTVKQLRDLAQTPGLDHYVAVLPDIHSKGRNASPTGTVVAAKNAIVPLAVDTGINCGIRMIKSDIDANVFTSTRLDELFDELRNTLPVKKHETDVLTESDVADILVEGGKWSQKYFGLPDEEMACIEDGGTMPTDTSDRDAVISSLSEKAIKKGCKTFCTLGAGNHFLELQEVVEIVEPRAAQALGLSKGNVFFMLHTGSRGVGKKMMKVYLEELKERFASEGNGAPIWSMPADSEEGVRYARAVSAASNFGFANRIAITEKLRTAVRKVLGHDNPNLSLLYDCGHVSIKREQWNGDRIWIHRHGASRALPASHFSSDSIFSRTGQPVPIPGSMGHDSFVGIASERSFDSFCSVNHGAGRVIDKPEAATRFMESDIEKGMRDRNIRLYRYHTDNIAEQAPSSFKNIDDVINAMSALSLAQPVVRLRPLAVLKG